ncbi:MAG: hypothetical protein K2X55_12730 [Burkholderiaceae bacterium]|nr:hypothetical protein [Burkholderiaceae bacterium]
MKRMEWNSSQGNVDARFDALCAPLLVWLEELRPGRRVRARDGTPFIRTNRTCICFCNLRNGALCSARDICRENGGVALEELKALGEMDHEVRA